MPSSRWFANCVRRSTDKILFRAQTGWLSYGLGRLDVDKHVGNARIALLDCRFHLMRNLVPFMHGNASVYSHVKIDIKVQSHLPDQAFFDVDDSGDRSRSISD